MDTYVLLNLLNFLSLRDDFDTVTGISDKSDAKRKYHLSGLLSHKDREMTFAVG